MTPRSARLDLFVAITNHFPPLSLARRSAAIVQFPFARLRDPGRCRSAVRAGLERRLRLRSYDTVLCYSEFVRRARSPSVSAIRRRVVLPPPVDTDGRGACGKGAAASSPSAASSRPPTPTTRSTTS